MQSSHSLVDLFELSLVVLALLCIIWTFGTITHSVFYDIAFEITTKLFFGQDRFHDRPGLYWHVFVV